jgi:hypothetical protein
MGTPMMITGLSHQNQNSSINPTNIPKPPSQTINRNRTIPKPH